MAIHKNAGTKQYISPTSVNVDTINEMSTQAAIAFFEAINDWIEIEEVEDHGTVGDTAEAITFTAVGNRRVRKLKGPRDAGTQALVVGRDPLDDGQQQLLTSEGTDYNYPHKIVMADARAAGYSNSVLYFAGMTMDKPTNLGNVTNVVRRNFNIGINTGVYEVASAMASAPTNTVLPAISGVVETGEVLTAFPGVWTGNPTLTYQWQADDAGNDTFADISGATSATFTALVGNVGDALRVEVTGVNAEGTPVVAYSAPTQLQGA